MATLNLLNLNVDTLFEQHSIGEIDVIHKKIQEVVENKREELRTMVGERYRDLLKAADTITAMQGSTKALIQQIDHISVNCRNLNEQQLLGFKTETDSAIELRTRNTNKQLNNYFSTMVQIKLLTSLPEMIWSHLDQEHYYTATELFIFSRHISTGLQLDSSNPLMQKLPVAKKQWEIIKPFHMTIKQQVLSALERENLGPELTVDCLLSLLQLDRYSVENALKTFLNLRSTAYLNCLAAETGRVKERILASLRVLNESLDMVSKCFMDNGLLFKKLKEHSDPSAPPTIVRMSKDDLQFAHLLPDIITNFKPTFDAVPLKNVSVESSLGIFLADTQRTAANQLKLLFDLVSNMNTIQDIKTEASSMRKQMNLITPLGTQVNLMQSHNFYELRYVPLINQRIRNIINDSWSTATDEMITALENTIQKDDLLTETQCILWQEFTSDLPNSLDQALSDDMKVKKLLMKSKGYDEKIIKIVSEFDQRLSAIIKEMNVLLEEPSSKLEDKQSLVDFLKETSQHHITDLITKVKHLQSKETHRFVLLFNIRFCCALVELCPHLKMCFCQASSWRHLLGSTSCSSTLEHWQRICALLEEEVYIFWLHLIDGLLEEYRCDRYLAGVTTNNTVLGDFAHWDIITLEQKDDQDMPVLSSFRIPTQPRISLQSYFNLLIAALKAVVPETLPNKVLNAFNQKLLGQFLQYYRQLLQTDDGSNATFGQNVALQLYFDLKFLQNCFDNNRDQKEQFTSLQMAYKEFIDPFDFELFSTQLTANIKRAVTRYNCLLGLLTPISMQNNQSSGVVIQERDPNVLSLSSSGATSLWFPLLPVVTNTNNSGVISTSSSENRKSSGTDSEKTTPTRSKVSNSSANTSRRNEPKSKSGAASFFGAMSQDWFR